MNALILAPFSPEFLQNLSSRLRIVYKSWTETRELIDPEKLIDIIRKEDIQVLVIEADFIFEDIFVGARNLRFVGVCRGAVNNVDIESATEHGVLVVNTPGRNSIAVAELTLGLAISLLRRIPEAHATIQSGRWEDPVGPYISMRGTELHGKVAGIIGMGAVGREASKRFQAFGMKILAYDPYVDASIVIQAGYQPADLNTLLKEADIISIHCSSTDETKGMIGEERVRLIKPTAFLINTASWDIVDEKALFKALESRSICGAGFDVFATHPLTAQNPLMRMNNVILTPHIGSATDCTVERHSQMITEDIFRFLEGKRPLNLLNPEAWRRNDG